MDESIILKNISRFINLTEKEITYFNGLLEFKKIEPREWLLSDGEVCKYSTFVTKGCLRGYAVDKKGFEHVLTFAPKGWWIADMRSLILQEPATINIQALQSSEVLMLSRKNQEKLYATLPKFERFFRIIAENSLISYQQRLMDNLSISARERYLKFCSVYPGLINEIPQKQVASYIGVTPEFLSKVKKKA